MPDSTTGGRDEVQPITRITMPMLAVLAVLLDEERSYGLRIAEAAGLRTGTTYPILSRLERAGWAASGWEDKDDPGEQRDPGAQRKYYWLTPEGRARAAAVLKAREETLARINVSVRTSRPALGGQT